MRPLSAFRFVPLLLSLLLLALAIPEIASGQPPAPGLPQLAPEARGRLVQAAGDPQLPQWQRDYMLRVAHRGERAARASLTGAGNAARAERALGVNDGSWIPPFMDSRYAHSAIYDPVRDRMVVLGGAGASNDVWALSLTGTPAWTQLTAAGTLPNARENHGAIYDPVRDRMVVFGGWGGGNYFNDVWALSLAGTPEWTELTPTGTPPSARRYQSTIYDPVRDRMVVFGGLTPPSTRLNDVWALSLAGTPAWTALTPTGTPPSARVGHSAVYDALRDRIVVFGGYAGLYLRDVWTLSLAGTPAWTLQAPSGARPSARNLQSAIYDPARDRMLVCGGYATSSLSDVWALSLAGTLAWTAVTSTGSPPGGRNSHSAILDPVRDRMVVFGGGGDLGFVNDAWSLSLAGTPAWTLLTPPSGRLGHSAIYDTARDRMVIFGGYAGSNLNDAWAMSLLGAPGWKALTPTGTPPFERVGHSAIYDQSRDRIVMFGGCGDLGNFNDVWALSLAGTPAWTALSPVGTPPPARNAHSAIYDPGSDRMVVFAGAGAAGNFNDVWELSLAGTPTWTALTPTGTPPDARVGHCAIYDPVGERMVVFGGDGGSSLLNDVWALSLASTPAWTQLTPVGTPPVPRNSHSAIYDPVRDRIVVFGGKNGLLDGVLNDLWALSLKSTPVWTSLMPSGTPPIVRQSHSALYDPVHDRMVVFGGESIDVGVFLNDVWMFQPGAVLAVKDPATRPLISELRPLAPNPTAGATTVDFFLATPGRIQLEVYDLSGRLVRRLLDAEKHAGAGSVVWDGSNASGARPGAGMYFVRLATPKVRMTRRVVLLR